MKWCRLSEEVKSALFHLKLNMKKSDNKAQKFLSCLDAIILSKNEKRRGETNLRHRDILRIELAELKGIRSLFISIFKIKPKEPPVQQKTNPTSKDNINALSNNKPNKLPLIEEKLSEGTNKLERKIDLKTNKKVKTIYTNAKMESRKDIKILVVDDEFAPRKALEIFLKQEGYDITTANGGAQALQLLLSNSYDLVTTCIIMPGMNGKELRTRIWGEFGYVSFLLMSGYSTNEQGPSAQTDFLQKPFTVRSLLEKVYQILSRTVADADLVFRQAQTVAPMPAITPVISPALARAREINKHFADVRHDVNNSLSFVHGVSCWEESQRLRVTFDPATKAMLEILKSRLPDWLKRCTEIRGKVEGQSTPEQVTAFRQEVVNAAIEGITIVESFALLFDKEEYKALPGFPKMMESIRQSLERLGELISFVKEVRETLEPFQSVDIRVLLEKIISPRQQLFPQVKIRPWIRSQFFRRAILTTAS